MKYELIKGDNEVTIKIGDLAILITKEDTTKVEVFQLNNDNGEYEAIEEANI